MSVDWEDRRAMLVQLLEREPYLSVSALARRFEVSEPTVRRDLRSLASTGKLLRVRGGAVSRQSAMAEWPFHARFEQRQQEKEQIAGLALELVKPEMVVALDIGTTPLYLAPWLAGMGITVVTPSIRAATLLAGGKAQVLVSGGRLRAGELSLIGSAGLRFVRSFRFDIFFMSVGGVSERGLTDFNLDEIEMKQEVKLRSAQTYALADREKFGRSSGLVICGIQEVNAILTDPGVDPGQRAAVEALGGHVRVARP